VGNIIATIDASASSAQAPAGVITRTYYDDLNRPLVVISNLVGQMIAVATPPAYDPAQADRNIGRQTFYDQAGRAYRTFDLTTSRSDWTCYDDAGRATRTVQSATVADPCLPGLTYTGDVDENLIAEYVYDNTGRQIATLAPDGLITRTYYDAADRRIAVTTNLVGQAISVNTPPTLTRTSRPAGRMTDWAVP